MKNTVAYFGTELFTTVKKFYDIGPLGSILHNFLGRDLRQIGVTDGFTHFSA
jgi:hypothetical protein